ncbi:hypothetical protein FIV42_29340 [Persicimonas caeni]|uniref:Uncharacterized protein n=1 Tax=Persicimonas caeni TaxID=2292766 RepID=A0A4Y6Q286_PERCE|nr:hypothetical protein [Persicimonas caeni]QDG54701.1 hypothetical protein FIV42_29340 [Persicimonas caeni]QED35922.1 hypothetical protein FRD00_29335 [Persicimonas caeni]
MERQSLIFLAVLVIFSLACGIIDDDDTNVSYEEEVQQSFTVDANQLCPERIDCQANQQPSPSDEELQPIEVTKDIDVVAETGNQELADFAGAFRSIEITAIDYKAENNDLTFDLPPTTLYVGPMGVTSKEDEGVVELATIPAIPAGENKTGQAQVSDSSRAASSELFKDLKLSTVVFAQPVVKKDQPLPPSGSTKLTLTIHVKFTANPQDAL